MVTKDLKKLIREKIGKGIATKFFDYLVDREIKKDNGEHYSKAHLRNYIYTEMNNELLNKEFLRFSQIEIEKIQSLQNQKKDLQQSLKKIA